MVCDGQIYYIVLYFHLKKYYIKLVQGGTTYKTRPSPFGQILVRIRLKNKNLEVDCRA